jgi:hypothetical protein
MINVPIYTVTGNTDITDDVLFCGLLEFTGPDAQLVIKPMPGAKPGARRMLKIVANVIDMTLAGGSGEITFNLDGDYLPYVELPIGDNGLDPETPAKPGDPGTPSYNLGPLPPADVATPNFTPLNPLTYVGSYPKAQNGGDGAPGARGNRGTDGTDGPILEIWTTAINGKLTLDLRGQVGGVGGNGGNGEGGGNGQMGSAGTPGTGTSWTGVPYAECVQGPGLGGDGGKGGNAGCGGDGGDGGSGGNAKIFYTSGVNLANVVPQLQGGVGGQPGTGGTPGAGGKAGPAGTPVPPCTTALPSQDGSGGESCRSATGDNKGGGVAKAGATGQDGQYSTYSITNLPKI